MSAPTVSVVVPTRNRPGQLADLLAALAEQDYPTERFEVIVVDDGSVTPMAPVLQPFADLLQLQHLRCDHGGPASARQAGVAIARAPYLAFTDDDCRPARDWLRALEAALERHPTCAIGGRTVNGIPGNLFSEASEALQRTLLDLWTAHAGEARFFRTNNVGFPTAGFRAVGGLDRTWMNQGGEDRDLCFRWQRHGYGMIYDPDMVVVHMHELTWRSFLAQHFRYGRGAFRFRDRHLRGPGGRPRLAPAAFYARLMLAPFAEGSSWPMCLIAALVLFAQAANAAGFAAEALRPRPIAPLSGVAPVPGSRPAKGSVTERGP